MTGMENLKIHDLMARTADMEKRLLVKPATNVSEQYAKSVAKLGDRLIESMPPLFLPRSLTDLIDLPLRDHGNDLIEETREINNRHVGNTIKTLEAVLLGDEEVEDLSRRVMEWSERVTRAILYKARRQFAADPTRTYIKIYSSAIHDLDVKVAHGMNNMFSLVWSSALELIPTTLIEEVFVSTGLVSGQFDDRREDRGYTWNVSERMLQNGRFIHDQFMLYEFQPLAYARDVVLTPLLSHLKSTGALPDLGAMQHDKDVFVADLLEAFPYLVSSRRMGKFMFGVPGAEVVAVFDFAGTNGFARIFLSDTEARFAREITAAKSMGMLELGFNGSVHVFFKPWKTLDSMFGRDDALRLTYWLLKQAHALVVPSFLKVSSAYMKRRTGSDGVDVEVVETAGSCYADYTDWLLEARVVDEELPVTDEASLGSVTAAIPQMRRSRFFKLLAECAVRIEQGKGSEIKLMRDGAHPFRLGNHYGPNPTVPSFLIASILKRLQISKEVWHQALQCAEP